MTWSEHGGPKPEPPTHNGFGFTILVSAAEFSLSAHVSFAIQVLGLFGNCPLRLRRSWKVWLRDQAENPMIGVKAQTRIPSTVASAFQQKLC